MKKDYKLNQEQLESYEQYFAARIEYWESSNQEPVPVELYASLGECSFALMKLEGKADV